MDLAAAIINTGFVVIAGYAFMHGLFSVADSVFNGSGFREIALRLLLFFVSLTLIYIVYVFVCAYMGIEYYGAGALLGKGYEFVETVWRWVSSMLSA